MFYVLRHTCGALSLAPLVVVVVVEDPGGGGFRWSAGWTQTGQTCCGQQGLQHLRSAEVVPGNDYSHYQGLRQHLLRHAALMTRCLYIVISLPTHVDTQHAADCNTVVELPILVDKDFKT